MSAIIGALRAELSASIAQFQNDMGKAADALKGFSKQAEVISKDLDRVGKKMSIAITAPLALLAKAGLDEAKQAREAMGQVEAALESTGGASGKTAAELQKSAKALQNLSTFDDDDILRNVTANLLTFANIQGPVFDRAQKAVVNLASRMGGDLSGAAIKVGRALNDPIEGVTALSRLGVAFTDQQKAQFKEMVKNGEGAKAQAVILDALSKKYDGAAEALRAASPDAVLVQAYRDFKELIGQIVIQILPPFTKALTAVLNAFQNLSPATQKWIVIGAALLATVGPLLVTLGSLVSIVGTLTPLVYGLGLAIVGLLGPIGLVIAAVTALIVGLTIWANMSDPVVKALDDQAKAHRDVADAMDTAKKNGLALTDAEAQMAKQKLALAAATLKAAEAQAQQNLQMQEALQNAPGNSLEGQAGAAIGTSFTASRARQQLDAIHKAQQQNIADQKALNAAVVAAPGAALGTKPGKLEFDAHDQDTIKKAVDAAKQLQSSISAMHTRISLGLDDLELPKSTTQANALNAQIDAFVQRAADAGVKTSAFAKQIETLRSRIEGLRQAGLEQEAQAFALEVNDAARAADKFAKGNLPPLQQKLQAVDDDFKSLTDKIADEISKNAALADSNDDARKAMERLQAILATLPDAHKKATEAAVAQARAEEQLADLAAKSQNLDTAAGIRDARVAMGAQGPMSASQRDLQATADELAKKQIEVQQTLVKMEADRELAAQQGHDEEVARLDGEIALQRQLADIVGKSTAEQIQATKTINDAFQSFTDDLSSSLNDMIVNFDFSLNSLGGVLRKMVGDLLKPATDSAASFISGGIKSLFAGVFDEGGTIGPGQWGIKSGMPEIIQGGTHGVSVMPLSQLSNNNGGGDIYIDARGADTAAVSRLARVVNDLQRREGGRVKSYNADQNARTR